MQKVLFHHFDTPGFFQTRFVWVTLYNQQMDSWDCQIEPEGQKNHSNIVMGGKKNISQLPLN